MADKTFTLEDIERELRECGDFLPLRPPPEKIRNVEEATKEQRKRFYELFTEKHSGLGRE